MDGGGDGAVGPERVESRDSGAEDPACGDCGDCGAGGVRRVAVALGTATLVWL